MPSSSHLTDDELERYLLGQILNEAELTRVEEHLIGCTAACIERAEEMTGCISVMKDALKEANLEAEGENRLPHRFLVVDDEVAIGRMLSLMLAAEGVDVTCLTEVTEESFGQLPGGLIAVHTALVDLHLGERSGVQAAQLLRRENPDIRVVFMSGYPRESAPEDIDSIADYTYLTKPVKRETLLSLVAAAAGRLVK